ncbi:MAG: 5-formyltetrahydrofolate cyclo-ligase [Alphaproteobacteria bacterium]|nr:5-formyltetrahydrofolate cyclo-ligase [Alphaproteobacteria bacterium]MBU0886725.1 5-formyltetrahydrofolate cyclo-ligase [Alphaproteobacteria bacterium]MBU1812547.1 5-formyltetrahydrofolate cyclo-ligase [Alphaproteobacteria bacterium]
MRRLEDIPAEKQALRATARLKRRVAHRDGPQAGEMLAARLLQEVPPPEGALISGYWPMADELDVMPTLLACAARGHPLCLPVTPKRGLPLLFRAWAPGDAMARGVWDIPVPLETAPEVFPDYLLVPLLAFDRIGHRLGYGGGFYDRTLALLRSQKTITAVGVAYAALEVSAVPHQDTDEKLDWIVTERAAIRVHGK